MAKKEFSVKGPIFKLAMEHGSDFRRFTPGDKVGKPTDMAATKSYVDQGIYAWFAFTPVNSWGGRALERWRVGVSEHSGDYVEFKAPKDAELSNLKDLAAAKAATAAGGKRKPPKALVKELIKAVKTGDEEQVARLGPLAASGVIEDTRPIDVAASLGNARFMELLLPHCDPNTTTDDGKQIPTALYCAVSGGSLECVELLLDRCDPKATGDDGWTALISAAVGKNLSILGLLLPLSDVDASTREGRTALLGAAQRGHRDAVELLLPRADLNRQDATGRTALMLALDLDMRLDYYNEKYQTRIAILRALLDAGADPNLRDEGGNTALILAVTRGALGKAGVTVLLPKSDANLANLSGDTALTAALAKKDDKLVSTLVKVCRVDHANAAGDTALIIAARAGRPESVAILVKVADVNAQNGKGRTALMEAFLALTEKKGHWSNDGDMGPLRCILRLIPLSALDLQDEDGVTALMMCAKNGLPELLGLLLLTSNVNLRDATGATALARLTFPGGDMECFDLLVERSDARIADNLGRTPLMRAGSDEEKILKLVGRSAIDARDNSGATALMLAAGKHHEMNTTKLLLDAGADPSLVDVQGRTAEAIARARGKDGLELANMLRDIVASQSESDELTDLIPMPRNRTPKKKSGLR